MNCTFDNFLFSRKNPNTIADINPAEFPIPDIICPFFIAFSSVVSECFTHRIINN